MKWFTLPYHFFQSCRPLMNHNILPSNSALLSSLQETMEYLAQQKSTLMEPSRGNGGNGGEITRTGAAQIVSFTIRLSETVSLKATFCLY